MKRVISGMILACMLLMLSGCAVSDEQERADIPIPTEFHSYPGLGHGFGIGKGTAAEGWLDEAVSFWEEQSN